MLGESWWARYTPHFYLFIIFSLYILYKYGKNKYLRYIYLLLIVINTSIPLLGNTYYTFTNSIKIRGDLKSLGNKEITLKKNDYHGVLYNLKDFNIKFKIEKNVKGKNLYYHYLEYKEK